MNQFIFSLWENYRVLSLMGIWQGANRDHEMIPRVHICREGAHQIISTADYNSHKKWLVEVGV